jgi:lactoylglutathione lyase
VPGEQVGSAFRLTGLDHVGLRVTDMERSLRFYQRLGLTLLRTRGPDADGVRTAVIGVGDQELNLFSNPAVVSSDREPPIGLDHFCLLVEAASVDDVVADLRRAGIEIARGPEKRRDGAAVFVHDPDGVRVELQLKNPSAA